MEIDERAWARIRADVAVHGTVAAILLKLHPQSAMIIEQLQSSSGLTLDRLLNSQRTDIELEELERAVANLVAAAKS
jgi:hypothetical protein